MYFRKILVLGHDVSEKLPVNLKVLPSLLKGDAVYLLALHRIRNIGRVNLNHVVIAVSLLGQNLQGFGGIAGGDDAVGHFSLDEAGGICIALIGQGDEIAEGRHAVGASCSRIGAGEG